MALLLAVSFIPAVYAMEMDESMTEELPSEADLEMEHPDIVYEAQVDSEDDFNAVPVIIEVEGYSEPDEFLQEMGDTEGSDPVLHDFPQQPDSYALEADSIAEMEPTDDPLPAADADGLSEDRLIPATGIDLNRAGSIDAIIDSMTTRQKITQCLMMDFRKWGEDASDMTVLDNEVADILSDYQFGSVILFANNIKQTEETVALTADMQKAVMSKGGLPLLIATDQEGGIVYRLGSGTALPGNMALGATGNAENARTAGEIVGRELDAVGINTTLAPVLDVNSNANNTVIGLRSFSDDAGIVGEFGTAFISGLDEYNIIGCAKHFPGHGDTETDSHYGLPVVDKSLSGLLANELIPFQAAIDNGVEMIMTAHILYPQLDSSTIFSEKTGEEESRPATMSRVILTDILRGRMGFDGVVITDAMNMAGVANNYTAEQSTLEALKAGADIICMPVTGVYDKDELTAKLDSILSYIEASMDTVDGLSTERLNEAVRRVLTLKANKGILSYDADRYTAEKAVSNVGSDENRALERTIAAKAVTLIKNENGILPYQAGENEKILMLCPYNNERAQMVMGLNRAKEAGLVPQSAEVQVYRFSGDDYELTEGGALKSAIDWADLVIINSEVSGSKGMSLESWISIGPKTYTEYCRENGKTSVILSVDKPYDVQLYPAADAILAVYGCKGSSLDVTQQLLDGEIIADPNACGPNITAGIEILFGVYTAEGRLPVNIPAFADGAFTNSIVYARGYGLTYETDVPQPVYSITYDLNGGQYNESTSAIVEAYNAGTVITLLEKPTRAGYEFIGWDGGLYQPGAAYTVTEDHIFTAQWKEELSTTETPAVTERPTITASPIVTNSPAATDKPVVTDTASTSSKTNQPDSVSTGDSQHPVVWLTILATTITALFAVLYKRRKHTSN